MFKFNGKFQTVRHRNYDGLILWMAHTMDYKAETI